MNALNHSKPIVFSPSSDSNQVMGWCSVAFSTLAVKSGNGRHFDLLTTDQKSGAIL
jgi:hypothetical protein